MVVALLEGRDSNHKSYEGRVPKDKNWVVVGPEYHALHHVDPASNVGSSLRIYDWIFGSACSIKGRRVIIVYGSVCAEKGSLRAVLRIALEAEGVSSFRDLEIDDAEDRLNDFFSKLEDTDILILALNPTSTSSPTAATLIDHFIASKKVRKGISSMILPEVWNLEVQHQVPSDAHAKREERRWYNDDEMIYRHIVFPDTLGGRGEEKTVRWIMWWIRRGARYIPPILGLRSIWEWVCFVRGY